MQRHQQAVKVLIGILLGVVLLTDALISGRQHGTTVAVASSVSDVHRMVANRPASAESTRDQRRHALQLLGLTTAKKRATVKIHVARTRTHVSASAAPITSAEQWAASARVRRIIYCESTDNPRVVSVHNGVTYYGLYQMNRDFWITYGGNASYLSDPFNAPVWLQNEVAYRGFLARGYEPWACA